MVSDRLVCFIFCWGGLLQTLKKLSFAEFGWNVGGEGSQLFGCSPSPALSSLMCLRGQVFLVRLNRNSVARQVRCAVREPTRLPSGRPVRDWPQCLTDFIFNFYLTM